MSIPSSPGPTFYVGGNLGYSWGNSDNRIIIIGGSGTHYGFSGSEVSRLTGLPAVNFGTHAGLGLSYLLYRAKQILQPGDFAVLVIEPNLYWSDDKPSTVLAEFLLRYDLPYPLHVRPSDAISIVYGYTPAELLQEQARRVGPYRGLLGRADTVDKNGDETLELSKIQTPVQLANVRDSLPLPAWSVNQLTRHSHCPASSRGQKPIASSSDWRGRRC
jgi:hypothetical protein